MTILQCRAKIRQWRAAKRHARISDAGKQSRTTLRTKSPIRLSLIKAKMIQVRESDPSDQTRRASKEKQKHSRKQAAEARRRRAEKANGRHAEPEPPKEKGRLVASGFYEIDKILDKRVNDKGVEEFLVRWKDCPESDDTWEPSDNLCDTAFADAERLFEEEKVKRELKLRESEKLLGLNEPVETMHCVKAEKPNEVNTPKTIEETQVPCDPRSDDEELPWKWNDEEQVVFREVVRIDVSDSDASRRVTEAREDGKPVVLVGHRVGPISQFDGLSRMRRRKQRNRRLRKWKTALPHCWTYHSRTF